MDTVLAAFGVFGLMLGSAIVAALWAAQMFGAVFAEKLKYGMDKGWLTEEQVLEILYWKEPK